MVRKGYTIMKRTDFIIKTLARNISQNIKKQKNNEIHLSKIIHNIYKWL